MYEFIRAHQLNAMLVLCGIPGIISFFVFVSSTLTKRRKISLMALELSAMAILIFDRFAYLYRGDTSQTGYWMVRLSNFMVFLLSPGIVGAFNLYITDLLTDEGKMEKVPKRLVYAGYLVIIGIAMVVFSQFTGFYYTFDENNRYQRAPGFIICYVIPILVLLIQLSVIIYYGKRLNPGIYFSIVLFTIAVIIASIAQAFVYGLSLTNITCVGMAVLLYIFALQDMNKTAERVHKHEIEYLENEKEHMSNLFRQTTSAFVNVIDAKNSYTGGHSRRVAKYSRMIAEQSGMDQEKCDEVYFAALLHDVGKMGIPDSIITKNERLTTDENELYMQHPRIGENILSEITEYSYLSDGAYYHHERYDGGGYPKGLKGDEIPEVARIIAVADFYDILTSKRNYRGLLPQIKVREEFIKEAGERFDPVFSKIMVQIIDSDKEYKMRGSSDEEDISWKKEMHIGEYRSDVSSGISFSTKVKKIRFTYSPEKTSPDQFSQPAIMLFDALDGLIHVTERGISDNSYVEFGEIFFDGHIVSTSARNMTINVTRRVEQNSIRRKLGMSVQNDSEIRYEIEAARWRDHVRVRITGGDKDIEVIAALADNSRYIYLSITGEHCYIRDIELEETGEIMTEGIIPRIADEISYIDRMEADIKNIQIEGNRTASTVGIPIESDMKIAFHTMSLPSAHFVWHCPYIVLFNSNDGKVYGPDYHEYAIIRLDGEIGDESSYALNKISASRNSSFEGWDNWMKLNAEGMECSISFDKIGSKIHLETENGGIVIRNTTTITDASNVVYAAITGDRCAITDIRVIRN